MIMDGVTMLLVIIVLDYRVSCVLAQYGTLIPDLKTLKSKFITLDLRPKEVNSSAPLNEDDKIITVLVTNVSQLISMKDNKTNGYIGNLWYAIEQYLQFKPIFIFSNKREALENGSVDISLIPLSLQSKYYDKYDCTVSLGKRWFNFYMNGEDYRSNIIYSSVWSSGMYSIVIALLMFVVVVQWGIQKYSLTLEEKSENRRASSIEEQNNKKLCFKLNNSFVSAFIHVYGLILQHGSQIRPVYKSAAILNVVCGLFGLLMITSYTALLISRITATQKDSSLNWAVQDLPETHSLCIATKGYAYKSLTKSRPDVDTQFLSKWKNNINKPPCRPGNNMVYAEDYCKKSTLVLEEHHLANEKMKKKIISCKVLKDSNFYYPSHLSLALRKGFPYKEKINQYLIRMQNYGIMSRIKHFWLPPNAEEYDIFNFPEYSISFSHISNLMYYYGQAVLCSLLILILEVIVHELNIV